MYILAGISTDGQLGMTLPCTNDAEPLLCTQAARAVLVERLQKLNGRCNRCGIFARSEELTEGHCVATVGCGKDPDMQAIIAAPGSMRVLILAEKIEVALQKWATAIKAAAEEATPTPSPTSPAEEDANDVLRDW